MRYLPIKTTDRGCCFSRIVVFLLTVVVVVSAVRAQEIPSHQSTGAQRADEKPDSPGARFDFRTKFVPQKYCDGLPDEVLCAELDAQVGERRSGERSFQRQEQQQRGLNRGVATRDVELLILLVRFTDHEFRTLPNRAYFEELCQGTSGTTTNPVGSLQDYFASQAGDVFSIRNCVVSDWITTDNTEASFSTLQGAADVQQIFQPAMTQYEAQQAAIDPFWWTPYDVNFDALWDVFLVIHSGYARQTVQPTDCDGVARDQRILTDAFTSSNGLGWEDTFGIIRVEAYAMVSAFEGIVCDSLAPVELGTIARELVRTLEVPPLYDFSVADTTANPGGIGRFGLMGTYREYVDGQTPGSLTAWTRNELGWVSPTVISADGQYSVALGEVYQITHGYAPNEYLLIESRQQAGFDATLPGGGIVIYHIDDSVSTENEETSFPGEENWPAIHYRVAVLQADGAFDLEKGLNAGDAGDFFLRDMIVGPGGTPEAYPNTNSYKLGETGFSILIMSDPGPTMQIFVSGISPVPIPFPQKPSAPPVPPPTVTPTAETSTKSISIAPTMAATTQRPTQSLTTIHPSSSFGPSWQPSPFPEPTVSSQPTIQTIPVPLGLFVVVTSPPANEEQLQLVLDDYLTAYLRGSFPTLAGVTLMRTTGARRNLQASDSSSFLGSANFRDTAPLFEEVVSQQLEALSDMEALQNALDASFGTGVTLVGVETDAISVPPSGQPSQSARPSLLSVPSSAPQVAGSENRGDRGLFSKWYILAALVGGGLIFCCCCGFLGYRFYTRAGEANAVDES